MSSWPYPFSAPIVNPAMKYRCSTT
jgi:hypothetical protein